MRLSKSSVGSQEVVALERVISRGFLGMGIETKCFEQELAAYLGGERYVICVNTGTSALHLALQAIGLGPGDEVLVPALNYIAAFQMVSATGALPVPCDVHLANGLLDLSDAENRITPRTKAIMPVHYASHCGNLSALYDFAKRHHLRVIEDAAHSFGCTYQNRKMGSFGDIVCFSFDGIKNITAGEGGALVTADQNIAGRAMKARLLGIDKGPGFDLDVQEQGWRYHMSDLMAAIGRVQLQRFDTDFKPKRIKLAQRYREKLADTPHVRFLETDLPNVVPHIQPVRLLENRRDQVRQALLKEDIQVGLHYKPAHLLSRYRQPGLTLPVSEQLYSELLTLPLHVDLTESDIDKVTNIVRGSIS